jgi:hypothetical protein
VLRAGFTILFFIAGVLFPAGIHGETNAFDVLVENERSGEPENLAVALTSFYQKHISSHDGARCMFSPTCSQYFKIALRKYGFIAATVMTVDRIFYREGKSSMKYYRYDSETDRFCDPVERFSPLEQCDRGKK